MNWGFSIFLVSASLLICSVHCFPRPSHLQNDIPQHDSFTTESNYLHTQINPGVLAFEYFEEIQFPLPKQPSMPKFPKFNCDPELYAMCDELQSVYYQILEVSLCQVELHVETLSTELAELGMRVPYSHIQCSRDDWSEGLAKLKEATLALGVITITLTAQSLRSDIWSRTSSPAELSLSHITDALLDCIKKQTTYFEEYQPFSQSIQSCKVLHLPSKAVSPETLESALVQLGDGLDASNKKLLIPTLLLDSYYNLPLARCSLTEGENTLKLSVPVVSKGTFYDLATIEPLQFAIEDAGICQVDVSPRTVIVEKYSKRVYFMEDEYRDVCLETGFCQIALATQFSWATKEASCISEILQLGSLFDTQSGVGSMCSFSCSKEDATFIYVENGQLVMDEKKIGSTYDQGVYHHVEDDQVTQLSPDSKDVLHHQTKPGTEIDLTTRDASYAEKEEEDKDGKFTSSENVAEIPFPFEMVDLSELNIVPGAGSVDVVMELADHVPEVSENELGDNTVGLSKFNLVNI